MADPALVKQCDSGEAEPLDAAFLDLLHHRQQGLVETRVDAGGEHTLSTSDGPDPCARSAWMVSRLPGRGARRDADVLVRFPDAVELHAACSLYSMLSGHTFPTRASTLGPPWLPRWLCPRLAPFSTPHSAQTRGHPAARPHTEILRTAGAEPLGCAAEQQQCPHSVARAFAPGPASARHPASWLMGASVEGRLRPREASQPSQAPHEDPAPLTTLSCHLTTRLLYVYTTSRDLIE